MGNFIRYKRKPVAELLIKWKEGMENLTISKGDLENGHPKSGDYVSQGGSLIAKDWHDKHYSPTNDTDIFTKKGHGWLKKIESLDSDLVGVSVLQEYTPKLGDYVARNEANHSDKWLVNSEDVNSIYELEDHD